jgi:hypothetical protein
MFYFIEVHFLDLYTQWIKLHGETVKFELRSLPILSGTGKLTEEVVGSEGLDYLQKCYLNILINKPNSVYYLSLMFKLI